jgi:ubiquinone/menaquinone biosynthesis C-methylase UbiE
MLNDDVRNIWNANAEFWDGRMGEGNAFHRTLIEPTQLSLLNIKPGQRILDVACGNGQFARKMAEQGAIVTATDFSEKMIEIAKSKPSSTIEYQVIDATRASDLTKLEGRHFDAVVCTMAIMDMESIEPLAGHLPRLLVKGGVFVFSTLHPCFNSLDTVLCTERDEPDGNLRDRYSVRVYDYLVERHGLGIAMVGQPQKQYYFHRPVSSILRVFFKAGFVLDGLEEPSFRDINSDRVFDNVYRNIPPALVCRLRRNRSPDG